MGKYQILDIAEIIEGNDPFIARGYSIVKTTRRVSDDDGNPTGEDEVVGIRIPIKSSGVEEYREEIAKKAPKPPVVTVDGAEVGQKAGERYRVFDLTDDAYVEAFEAHANDLTFKVVAFAIDAPIKNADGNEAKEIAEKEAILKRLNLTAHQIEQIAADIQALTMIESERADFLSARRSG